MEFHLYLESENVHIQVTDGAELKYSIANHVPGCLEVAISYIILNGIPYFFSIWESSLEISASLCSIFYALRK